MNIKELTDVFRKLGAREPELWARSQVNEGIDQLARFAFLREAWKAVLPPDDASWIDHQIASAKRRPDDPGAGAGLALERLLAAGADRKDLHELARVLQYEVLFALCDLLDDPYLEEPELADMAWRLVRIDDAGKVIGTIDGLHESVLELDPSGREMRPRRSTRAPTTAPVRAKAAAKPVASSRGGRAKNAGRRRRPRA